MLDIEIAKDTSFLATEEGIYQYTSNNEIVKVDCNATLNATQINDILFALTHIHNR